GRGPPGSARSASASLRERRGGVASPKTDRHPHTPSKTSARERRPRPPRPRGDLPRAEEGPMSRRTTVAASSVAFLVVAGLIGAACSGGGGGGTATIPQAGVEGPRGGFAGAE